MRNFSNPRKSGAGVKTRRHQPVVVKDLKAVDIQHPDDGVFPMQHWVVVFNLDDAVDAAHDPAEEPLIEGLKQEHIFRGAPSGIESDQ